MKRTSSKQPETLSFVPSVELSNATTGAKMLVELVNSMTIITERAAVDELCDILRVTCPPETFFDFVFLFAEYYFQLILLRSEPFLRPVKWMPKYGIVVLEPA